MVLSVTGDDKGALDYYSSYGKKSILHLGKKINKTLHLSIESHGWKKEHNEA